MFGARWTCRPSSLDGTAVDAIVYAREITATEFKARCLRLLDEVSETGEPLVVTKRGRPVVRVESSRQPIDLRGSVKLLVDADAFVEPLDIEWDAERA